MVTTIEDMGYMGKSHRCLLRNQQLLFGGVVRNLYLCTDEENCWYNGLGSDVASGGL